MTMRLLADWTDYRNGRQYKISNLVSTDAGTEAGLVAAKLADTNLTGGTAWVAPVGERNIGPALVETRPDGSQYLVSGDGNPVGDTLPAAAQCLRSGQSAVGWTLTNNGSAEGTMAVTASGSPFGYPALRVAIPNDTGTVDVAATGLGLPNFLGGRAKVVVHLYIESELGVKQVRVYAGIAGLTRNLNFQHLISSSNLCRVNGHHVIALHPDNAGENVMLPADAVNDVRMRISSQPGGSVVWIGGIYVPDSVQPWMVVTFDDAHETMYSRTHAELRARSLRGTFGINWDDVGTNDGLYVNQAKLDEMYAYGHDLVSHNRTNTPYPATMPPTAQPSDANRLTYCTDFSYTRNVLRTAGYTRALGYHPLVQGAHDGALIDAMKAHGLTLARSAGTAGNVEPFMIDRQSIVRQRSLGNTADLAAAQAWVDSAVLRGQDVFAMGHILADTSSSSVTWAQSNFAGLLDYALSKGVRVGSISEWARARGVAV